MAKRKTIRSADSHLYFCKANLRDDFVAILSPALRERLAKHRPGDLIGGYRTYFSLPIPFASELVRAQMLWERK